MEKDNNATREPQKLTKEEKIFCKLFMLGEAPYGGNAAKCYADSFDYNGKFANAKAKKLLQKPHIKEYVETLREASLEEVADIKRYLTKTYMRIIDECSEGEYCDRNGTPLSPAALRSVVVNAGKALAEMYPVKAAQVSKLNIGGEEGSNAPSVTFNVIVPGAQNAEVEVRKEDSGK